MTTQTDKILKASALVLMRREQLREAEDELAQLVGDKAATSNGARAAREGSIFARVEGELRGRPERQFSAPDVRRSLKLAKSKLPAIHMALSQLHREGRADRPARGMYQHRASSGAQATP